MVNRDRTEEVNLLAILESTSESIWSIDTNYQVTYANRVFIEEYQKAFGILLSPGGSVLQGLPENLATIWRARYDLVLNNKPVQVVDFFDLPAGGFYFSITFQPIVVDGNVVGAAIYSRDITTQKNAEIELQRTKEFLEQASEMAKVGAFEINPQTREVTWSKITRQIHEVPEDFKINLDGGILFYREADRPKIEAAVTEAITNGLPYDGEHQIITLTNKRKWVRIIFRPEFKDNHCLRLYGTVQDITDRKLASEMRQQFIRDAPTAIAMFDTQMRYLTCSNKWIEDFKLEQIELVGKSHYEVFPEIQEDWKKIHQRCLSGESMERDEDMFMRQDGSFHWSRWRIKPWYRSSGAIGGIILLTENITQKKLATYRAIQYSRIFEKSLNEIYILDAKTYHFKQVNAAGQANLGYTMEELSLMRPSEIIPNLTVEDFEKIILPLREGTRDKIILQKSHLRKNRTQYPVEIHLQYITVENDAYLVCFILDISEKTIYLHAIEEQNTILKEIAWVQSHVLRAPLSRMMMLLMLLENEDIMYHSDDLLKNEKDVVQAIANSANELDGIISKIVAKTKELEIKKPPIEPSGVEIIPVNENFLEVLLVDQDELGQLVNRYSIIQHGLHEKPIQFRDCQFVWEYLQEQDREGKTFLILIDESLLETDTPAWIESLQKPSWLSTISVVILSSEQPSNLNTLAEKYPTTLGVIQNPLKKQQIDHLRNLIYMTNN